MKKSLEDIRDELEIEIDTARALFEIMLLINKCCSSSEKNETTFGSFENAFSLLSDTSEVHVRNLDSIANCLADPDNDLKNE